MQTAARREVKSISGERASCLNLDFATLVLLASEHASVLARMQQEGINTLAMELPPIALHPHALPLVPSAMFIAASPEHIPVLRLGIVIGVIGLWREARRSAKLETYTNHCGGKPIRWMEVKGTELPRRSHNSWRFFE